MEAIRICAVCGRVISEDDGWNIVNEGTDKEYIECDSCHDAEWESNKISVCAGCGGWFTVDMLHSEEPVPGHTFCPCPSCGKEGSGTMEFLRESENANGERIDWCTQCKSYCPTIDLRERGSVPDMDAMALGMMYMDIVAAQKGLIPLKPSFWNQF